MSAELSTGVSHRLLCGLKRRRVKTSTLKNPLKKGKEKRHLPIAVGKCLIGAGKCLPVSSNFYSYYTAVVVGSQVPSVLKKGVLGTFFMQKVQIEGKRAES